MTIEAVERGGGGKERGRSPIDSPATVPLAGFSQESFSIDRTALVQDSDTVIVTTTMSGLAGPLGRPSRRILRKMGITDENLIINQGVVRYTQLEWRLTETLNPNTEEVEVDRIVNSSEVVSR